MNDFVAKLTKGEFINAANALKRYFPVPVEIPEWPDGKDEMYLSYRMDEGAYLSETEPSLLGTPPFFEIKMFFVVVISRIVPLLPNTFKAATILAINADIGALLKSEVLKVMAERTLRSQDLFPAKVEEKNISRAAETLVHLTVLRTHDQDDTDKDAFFEVFLAMAEEAVRNHTNSWLVF